MTPRENFVAALTAAGRMFRTDVDIALVKIWIQSLDGIDLNSAAGAIQQIIKKSRFMPLPVDVRNFVIGDDKVRAHNASRELLQLATNVEIAKSDDPLTELVVRDMGGWARFGNASLNDWKWVIRDFEERYQTYLANPVQASANLEAIGSNLPANLLEFTGGINKLNENTK